MHLLGFSLFSDAWLFDLAVYAHCVLGMYIIIWETKRSEWWSIGALSVTTLVLAYVTWTTATQKAPDQLQLIWHAIHLSIGLVALFYGLARPAKDSFPPAPQHVTSEFEQQALAKKEVENAPLPNFVEESASPEMMAASPSAVKAGAPAATPINIVAEPPVLTPASPLTSPALPVATEQPVEAAPLQPRSPGAPPPVPGKARQKPAALPVPQPEPEPVASSGEAEEAVEEGHAEDSDDALLDPEPQPTRSQQQVPSAYSPPPGTMNQGVPRKAEPRNPETPRTRGPLPAGISPSDSSLARYATQSLPNPNEASSVPRKAEPRKPGQGGPGSAALGKPTLPGGRTGPLPRMNQQRPPPGAETIIETPTLASTQPFKILPHAPPPQEIYTPQVRGSHLTGSVKLQPSGQPHPGPAVPGPGQSVNNNAGRQEVNRSTGSPASPARKPALTPQHIPGPALPPQQSSPIQARQQPPAQQKPPAAAAIPPAGPSTALQPINRTLSTTVNRPGAHSAAANSAASAFVSALKERIAPFLEENVQPELISPGREDELRHRVEELVDLKFAQDGVNPGPRLRAMLLQDLYRDIPLLSEDGSDQA